MNRKTCMVAASAMVLLSFASGCAKPEDQAGDLMKAVADGPKLGNEPIVLKFFNYSASVFTDEEMNDLLLKPIQKLYPNITFQRMTGTLENMIASGDLPDLIGGSNVSMRDMIAMGVASDLSPLIERDRLDLSHIEPGALEVLRKFSSKGELFAIPHAMNYGVTVYNKDIFDRFNVPYPKDNMTWNETIELAKRVTKLDDGTQYVGLDMGAPRDLTMAYSLPTVDVSHKSALMMPGYKKVFDLFAQLYEIPGIVGTDSKQTYKYGLKGFFEDQILAMYPYWLTNTASRIHALNRSGKAINWDVVTWPTFDDKPGLGRQFDFHVMMIPPTSKNKEAAFRVLEALVSTEAQKAMNRGTRLTVLKDPALKKEFASDLNIFENKNLEGVFKVKPAPYEIASPYDTAIHKIMDTHMKDIATKDVDVNTVLRAAHEAVNKEIETQRK